jgi:hypothetical protein
MSHACAIHSNPAGRAEAVVQHLRDGLEAGERAICIVHQGTGEEVRVGLAAEGIDVAAAAAAGCFRLLGSADSCLRRGRFSSADMISLLQESEWEALAAGHAGLRISCEIGWAFEDGVTSDELLSSRRS